MSFAAFKIWKIYAVECYFMLFHVIKNTILSSLDSESFEYVWILIFLLIKGKI